MGGSPAYTLPCELGHLGLGGPAEMGRFCLFGFLSVFFSFQRNTFNFNHKLIFFNAQGKRYRTSQGYLRLRTALVSVLRTFHGPMVILPFRLQCCQGLRSPKWAMVESEVNNGKILAKGVPSLSWSRGHNLEFWLVLNNSNTSQGDLAAKTACAPSSMGTLTSWGRRN